MKISELLKLISKLKKEDVTQAEFARALHLTPTAISKRIERKSEATIKDLLQVAKYFNVPVQKILLIEGGIQDSVEIKYYEGLNIPDSLLKHKKVTSIWYDREIVHDVWEKDEKNLRCIRMIGDRMKTGNGDSINQGDVVIFDTTMTNTLCSGVYVYTAGLEDMVFVGNIEQNLDESLTFTYRNPKYEKRTRSAEELKELGFRVLGKYIKNASKLEG